MKIFGLDISLDHGGVVCLNKDGSVSNYLYLTTTKKMADVDPDHGIFLSKKGKDESKDVFRLRRMNEYLGAMMDFERKVSVSLFPSYYSVEGYSYASQSTSMCQIAELTGYLKHMIFEGGGHIRIHDPLTVKLFATGKGNCMKKDVVEQALLEFDIPNDLIKRKKIKKKGLIEKIEEFDGPATDIADAYFLARMVHIELKLRSGELTLDRLREKHRRIFLRTSRMYPVNMLDREFIQKIN
jgi:hypothetical protein